MLVYAWMLSLQSRLQSRLEEDRGATAVEYGLLIGLVSVALISVFLLLGGQMQALFSRVAAQLGSR